MENVSILTRRIQKKMTIFANTNSFTMKRKKLRITQEDYLKANRRASRQEEIESHGHPVQGRAMIHKSKKVYDRNGMKRAAIKSDDSSHFYSLSKRCGTIESIMF